MQYFVALYANVDFSFDIYLKISYLINFNKACMNADSPELLVNYLA